MQSLCCGPFVPYACGTPFDTNGISEHGTRAVLSHQALASAVFLQQVPPVIGSLLILGLETEKLTNPYQTGKTKTNPNLTGKGNDLDLLNTCKC